MPDETKSVLGEFSCGAFGGTIGACVVHPIDTVKTRLQAGLSTGTAACTRALFRAEGLRGFYRGFAVPIFYQPM